MDMWEYLTVKLAGAGFLGLEWSADHFTEQLNVYGLQGWELVAVRSTTYSKGETHALFAFLKRKIGS